MSDVTSDFTPPPVGSRVAFTVTGIVSKANEDEVHFENGIEIETRQESFAPETASFKVIDPVPQGGAVGIHLDYLAARSVVLYRETASTDGAAGWYTRHGMRVPSHTVRPLSRQQMTSLLFSQDEPLTSGS